MLNTACTIYQRKMYAHADLELQWLLLLFGETRVIFVLGNYPYLLITQHKNMDKMSFSLDYDCYTILDF